MFLVDIVLQYEQRTVDNTTPSERLCRLVLTDKNSEVYDLDRDL